MKVFVTGATGFIGSAIVHELLANGHQVLGLARSDEAAASLVSVGADVQRGTLENLDSLYSGAAASNGVIHVAFRTLAGQTSSSAYTEAIEIERRAIEALGAALVGTDRPLVVTSATAFLLPGRIATEEDVPDANSAAATRNLRNPEDATLSLVSRGVRASVVRLPLSVHGEGDHGFISNLITTARAKGVSAYPDDGLNRWPAVHRLDAAHLYRLALENAPAGSRLHAVADEGIPVREIAEVIGRHLNVPVVSVPVNAASEHFGWLGHFFSIDFSASSTLTQQRFGWHPVQLGLLADIDHGYYFNHEK